MEKRLKEIWNWNKRKDIPNRNKIEIKTQHKKKLEIETRFRKIFACKKNKEIWVEIRKRTFQKQGELILRSKHEIKREYRLKQVKRRLNVNRLKAIVTK